MATLSNDVVGETVVTLCLLRVPFASHGSAAAVCRKWRDILKTTQFLAARRSGGFSEHALYVCGGKNGVSGAPKMEGWLRVGETWHPCRVPARAPRQYQFESNDLTAVDIGNGKAAFVGYDDCVKIYDVKQDSWTNLPRMRTARFEPVFAFVKNTLVVVSGRESSRIGSRILSTGETYDFVSQTWSAMPDIPIPLYSPSVGVIGDKVYVAGGMNSNDYEWDSPVNPYVDPDQDSNGVLNVLQVYCSTSRTWKLKKRMRDARFATATAVRDGKLHVIGGEIYMPDDGQIYTCSAATFYCPEEGVDSGPEAAVADTWYWGPYLPSRRVCAAACVWNDSIVLFGSGSTQNPMPPLINGIDADKWDWKNAHEFSDFFTDTDSDPEVRRRRTRRILDADSSDSVDTDDERWWDRRTESETSERAGRRRTRRAWRVFRGCPAAIHEISAPAVVSLELG